MARFRLLGAALACTLASTLPLGPAAAQDTIDRPINIYVAGTAGGGIDLYARLLPAISGATFPASRRSTCR